VHLVGLSHRYVSQNVILYQFLLTLISGYVKFQEQNTDVSVKLSALWYFVTTEI
jgi:hypothetical protein